ncbi:MAG: hypothetical protein RBG13Loki_0051 [Promethearchaeota archaeon CR_4]|nr:MAG: hypothetical protein RBG13Loki_0051 [Candidatus Lokiarchaeota archaeon CR_4]
MGVGGDVWNTLDGGQNWIQQSSPTSSFLFGVSSINATYCWAVGWDGTIIHTENGGVSTINVLTPDKDTVWDIGPHAITWTSSGPITNVIIELYKGAVLNATIAAITENDGNYIRTIETWDNFNGTDYRIKITDHDNPGVYAWSDYFVITVSPPQPPTGIGGYDIGLLLTALTLCALVVQRGVKKRAIST